jgi:hypothetical protein
MDVLFSDTFIHKEYTKLQPLAKLVVVVLYWLSMLWRPGANTNLTEDFQSEIGDFHHNYGYLYPEDGGSMFLLNNGTLIRIYGVRKQKAKI